jgi:protein ImuA
MNNNSVIRVHGGSSLLAGRWPEGSESERLPLGASALDQRLRGGLPRAVLHEIFAAKSDDIASSSAFAIMLALRLADIERPILWVMEEKTSGYSGRLYPPGLVAFGGNPDAMILVETHDIKDALRASADAIRSGATGAVILSVRGNVPLIDLNATRRLALAAARTRVLALLLRFDATPVPSAAYSRWQVASAPSRPLAADAPGFPAFDIALTRHRGGVVPFAARVEWNHEERAFRESPLSGGLSATVVGGAHQTSERKTA